MAALGLPMPGAQPGQMPPMAAPSAKVYNLGGVLPVANVAATLEAEKKARASAFESQQASPVITNLAVLVRQAFNDASDARQTTEEEMIEAMYARRGQYTSDKLQQIQANKQPAIYMMIAASKMRQVESLLRDVLLGSGDEKPWTLSTTPDPDVPPELAAQVVAQLTTEILQAMQSGFMPSVEQAQIRLRQLRDEVQPLIIEEATKRVERMEFKMEDQLLEGGFLKALDEFITDLATFKTAFMAGPIVRKKPKLSWADGGAMVVEESLVLEWERVDPFEMYPARYACNINDGPLVRKRRLSRMQLTEMKGVEGFDEEAIDQVLNRFGDSGMYEWLAIDSSKADAEGKNVTTTRNESGLIDVLQYWGSASGKMLREFGMDETAIPDESKEYVVEAWVIGTYVIKAMLNADPLARRPFYAASFQAVPGSVWGSSPYDLMRDCQDMCNASARALAANLGIASGPQVSILSNRISPDEEVTDMHPWKIWQFTSDAMGSTERPIDFFQPQSNANELMTVYERFALLADEYTGIPRYMSGFNGGEGGAGRTASGISMMIGNASKVIKQVIGGIDTNVIKPLLERLYYYNMRYGEDPDLKGDIKVHARGALSLQTKEAAQVRNNEFLQVALNSPVAQQIMGIEGVAEILRRTAKTLDHNPDKVVPPLPVIRQRIAEQAAQTMMLENQQGEQATGNNNEKPGKGDKLQNGAPATDNYSPR